MQSFTVYAPAKLNLFLNVLGKRPDGYHNLETLFEKIDLMDEIIVREKRGEDIDVKVKNNPLCPEGKGNIVYKAIHRLLKGSGKMLGLEIIILKKIPVSAGLGGGSSDAASVMRSINERFNLGISRERLFSLATEIGKDVPFFMEDRAFSIGRATGELLEPIDTKLSLWHIIVKPEVALSTATMYKRLDSSRQSPTKKDIKAVVRGIKDRNIAMLRENYFNIFENVLADCRVFIEKAKDLLLKGGAEACFLSGSGPSVFCTVGKIKDVEAIFKKLPKQKGMEIFLAATYKGGIYGDNRG